MAEEEQRKNAVGLIAGTTPIALGEGGAGGPAEGVPQDHLRYITALKLNNIGSTGVITMYEGRGSSASGTGGTLTVKDQQNLTQYGTLDRLATQKDPVAVIQGSSMVLFQTSGLDTSSAFLANYSFLDRPGGG